MSRGAGAFLKEGMRRDRARLATAATTGCASGASSRRASVSRFAGSSGNAPRRPNIADRRECDVQDGPDTTE
jgi:hypothetical protein